MKYLLPNRWYFIHRSTESSRVPPPDPHRAVSFCRVNFSSPRAVVSHGPKLLLQRLAGVSALKTGQLLWNSSRFTDGKRRR